MSEKATLTEAAELHATNRRVLAAAEYRRLLLKNNPKDAVAIVEIMTALGRDPGHLHEDVQLVRQLAENERLVKSAEKLQDELVRRHAMLDEALRETKQAREELERSTAAKIRPLEAARNQAQLDLNTAKGARSTLAMMQEAWAVIERGGSSTRAWGR